MCLCVFMCVSAGSKWCSYVSVCTAVRAHSSMLVFTCKQGIKWEPERGRGFGVWSVSSEVSDCAGMRELAFK